MESTRPADLVFDPTIACWKSRGLCHYCSSPVTADIWSTGGAGLTS